MTFFLQDILRQPQELQRSLDFLGGPGSDALIRAASAMRSANHVYLTGMGSSWHAALNASYICHRHGIPAHTLDACDLLELGGLTAGSVLIMISRSGRSVELEPLVALARAAGATVVGLTNNAESPLALLSDIPIVVPVTPDHAISVNTFSTLALAAAALANAAVGRFDTAVVSDLGVAFQQVAGLLPIWQEQLSQSTWLAPGSTCYFLARRSSFGSAQEARLMWEEGVKAPATAMGTGSFRHGPQEIVTPEVRFCLWIDKTYMREQDLAVARDLKRLGSHVMLIGQNLPEVGTNLMFQLPEIAQEWQFLLDVIPAQLVAERLSQISGVNCDVFRYCSFIVEDDYGLISSK